MPQFKTARLELTGNCDFKCLYCHAGQKNNACKISEELPLERWLGIIDEAKQLGVKKFILSGGEPLLHPHWQEIVRHCGPETEVIFSTNGNHFNEKNLEILARLPYAREFRTSLDGLQTNDIIRHGSSYVKSLESLRRLKQRLPDSKIMVQTVVYRNNLNELKALYNILKDQGVYWWRLSQLWKTVWTEKNRGILDFSDYNLMFSAYTDIIRTYLQEEKPFRLSIDNVYDSNITLEPYANFDFSAHPCAYHFDFLCINANGDLVFCIALNLPHASVKNQSIVKAFETSVWLKDFQALNIGMLPCGNCRYLKICGGGCRADSLRWLGELKTLDPNACCVMRKIEEIIIPLLDEKAKKVYLQLIDVSADYPPVNGENIEQAVEAFKRR